MAPVFGLYVRMNSAFESRIIGLGGTIRVNSSCASGKTCLVGTIRLE
jgi:hypothetical protein